LIEYEEINGVPGFQQPGFNVPDDFAQGADTYYGVYGNNATQFVISVGSVQIDSNDATFDALEITFSTPDNVFNYSVVAAGRTYTTPGGVTLNENTFKLSFNINFGNYAGFNDHPTSKLTMVLLVASTAGNSQNFNSSEPLQTSLNLQGAGGYIGFMTFEKQAALITPEEATSSCDIIFQYVPNNLAFNTSSLPAGWSGSVIFLNFDAIHPAFISYDPEIGATLPQTSPTTSTSSSGISFTSTSTTGSPAKVTTTSSSARLVACVYLFFVALVAALL